MTKGTRFTAGPLSFGVLFCHSERSEGIYFTLISSTGSAGSITRCAGQD